MGELTPAIREKRGRLLHELAVSVGTSATQGQLVKGRTIKINRAETVSGPRAGAVEFYAGMDAGNLYKSLAKNDAALARQFVPWRFEGKVFVYMNGKAVRVEVGWPSDLAMDDFPIHDKWSPRLFKDTGRWVAGLNDLGAMVTIGFRETTAHFLVSGTTGSGKSFTIRSAAWQLAQHEDNRLILIDGKMGEGLGPCSRLPHLMGPLATNADLDEVIAVTSWLVKEMDERYPIIAKYQAEGNSSSTIISRIKRLVVFIDEVQELTQNETIRENVRRLLAQGRAAHIHCILATQNPTADVFGDRTIKPNLAGRIALKTTHAEASRAALGQATPRSDWLLGRGDAYCLTSHSSVQRVQMGYVPPEVFASLPEPEYIFDEWPTVGLTIPSIEGFSPEFIAVGILAAQQGRGRRVLNRMLGDEGLSRMGKTKSTRLLALGKAINQMMQIKASGLVIPVTDTSGSTFSDVSSPSPSLPSPAGSDSEGGTR